MQELGCGQYEGARRRSISTAERRAGDFVSGLIRSGCRVSAVHDVSDGGLLVAVAEMALAGGRGVELDAAPRARSRRTPLWFGEDQGRYVVAAAPDEAARDLAGGGQGRRSRSGCWQRRQATALTLPGEAPLSLSKLTDRA